MNRLMFWTGRLLAAILTILCAMELVNAQSTGIDHRMVIICFVALVFTVVASWQLWIAWRRDGWPRIPPSFRWVMALFLASIALFTVWSVAVATFVTFSREVSIVMWWQLGMSSLYFLVRWINLGGPREAGVGETGSAGQLHSFTAHHSLEETMTIKKPVIYDLRNDADALRFGLSPRERDQFMQGCFWNRNGAKPRAIFCHVQEGKTTSSLRWAIEKPGGQNSYSYTAQLDGSILACIPEAHGPWTNGAVRTPKAKARKLIDLGGNPNLYTISIECEGYYNQPHPQVQLDAIYWLIQDIAARWNIPVLGDDSLGDWLFEHADVDTVQRSNCAGPYYDTIQSMVRKGTSTDDGGEVVAPKPQYAPVSRIPDLDEVIAGDGFAPAIITANSTTWVWVGDTVEAIRDTPRYQYADEASAPIGPVIPKGSTFAVSFVCFYNGKWWYYTPHGTRVKQEDTRRINVVQAA